MIRTSLNPFWRFLPVVANDPDAPASKAFRGHRRQAGCRIENFGRQSKGPVGPLSDLSKSALSCVVVITSGFREWLRVRNGEKRCPHDDVRRGSRLESASGRWAFFRHRCSARCFRFVRPVGAPATRSRRFVSSTFVRGFQLPWAVRRPLRFLPSSVDQLEVRFSRPGPS